MFDLVISDAMLLDGLGSPPRRGGVAVKDGRIVEIGKILGSSKETVIADGLALMPGIVEGHSHVAEGAMWRFVYCGYFDRTDPDGKIWAGAKGIEEVIARLMQANTAPESTAPLPGWSTVIDVGPVWVLCSVGRVASETRCSSVARATTSTR